ncbi:MAG: hypothetical protein HT580_11775 [Dechloromonas sp.]|nr:MAG: hypothetical protein HT580_11775 [Dechloromonas sp.]
MKKTAAKKPSRLEETKARNKKALSEALVKAQAVQIPPPPVVPQVPAESAKAAKPAKAKKVKLVRHSFSMPETEYAQIAVLKADRRFRRQGQAQRAGAGRHCGSRHSTMWP